MLTRRLLPGCALAVAVMTSSSLVIAHPDHDLTGDGKSDVLVRNTSTGWWYLFPMSGHEVVAGIRGPVKLTSKLVWQTAGVADFTGDGKADVLIRNTSTGQWFLYPMDGLRPVRSTDRGPVKLSGALSWEPVALADFTGDGKADVLVRNKDTGRWYMYEMNGRQVVEGSNVGPVALPDRSWQLAGVADFTGDGKADVLVRHRSTGEWSLYPLNGRSVVSGADRGSVALPTLLDWQPAGVADLTGDGKADALLRNRSTGEWSLYPLDGRRVVNGAHLGAVDITDDLAWAVEQIEDFTGDRKADVLLRNSNTGEWSMYPMDGRSVVRNADYGPVGMTRNTTWQTVGNPPEVTYEPPPPGPAPAPEPAPSDVKFPGFDFEVREGDFWQWQWSQHSSRWAQGAGGHSSTTTGALRLTLGPAHVIDGVTVYEAIYTGHGYEPRWKYFAVHDHRILASDDGQTLVTLFDGRVGAWPGSGFFDSSDSSVLHTAENAHLSNDFIETDCLRTGVATESTRCQYFAGVGTICGSDTAQTYREYEYYQPGVGIVGYYYYNAYSSDGGGFSSGGSTQHEVGLVASSLWGDSLDYELERESNNSPSVAQPLQLPAELRGQVSTKEENLGTEVWLVDFVAEVAGNDSIETAQHLTPNSVVNGEVHPEDPHTRVTFDYQGETYYSDIEDWYLITVSSDQDEKITVRLDYSSDPDADVFLFFFDDVAFSNHFAYVPALSAEHKPAKTLTREVPPGTYLVGVDGIESPRGPVKYTLEVVSGESGKSRIKIEDWYSFTLEETTRVTIRLDPLDEEEEKAYWYLDLHLFDASGSNHLAGSTNGNSGSSDIGIPEEITTTLQPGTYVVGVGENWGDSFWGGADYILTIR